MMVGTVIWDGAPVIGVLVGKGVDAGVVGCDVDIGPGVVGSKVGIGSDVDGSDDTDSDVECSIVGMGTDVASGVGETKNDGGIDSGTVRSSPVAFDEEGPADP